MQTLTDSEHESDHVPHGAPAGAAERNAGTTRIVWTLVALVVGVLLVVTGLSMARAVGSASTEAADATATAIGSLEDNNATLSDASEVGEAVIPSVVTIQIGGTFRSQEVVVGSGSGIIYDDGGHIITNAHVVEAGETYEVVLSDGRVYEATLVGVDSTTDIAVLDVQAEDLTPIAIGNTADLEVGDPAIAVGSPLGLDGGPSLTVGVISAFDRLVEIDSETALYGMLQADAPITNGSSGGALVDQNGRLIGLTSAVGVGDAGVEGVGFSTPVEIVVRVVEEIIATGGATQPYLGISGSTAMAATDDGGEQPIGVEVGSVETGSAADEAGISEGDVVTAIGGEEVSTMEELIALLRRHSAGDTVTVAVDGGDGTTVLAVTLTDR